MCNFLSFMFLWSSFGDVFTKIALAKLQESFIINFSAVGQ